MALQQAAGAVALPRRRAATRSRARRRSSLLTFSLIGIIVVFLVALVYLAHTLQQAATTWELDQLATERTRLERELRSLQGDIARWGAEPAILSGAQQAGMSRLGESIRVPAR